MASRSRWFVGSSSSSTSGAATSACASATRFFSPPDSVATTRAPSRCEPVQGGLDTLLPVPAVERLEASLQRVEIHALGACAS